MKIVINSCFGGFGLSDEAQSLYAKKSGFQLYRYEQTAYKHSDGKQEYTKIKDGKNGMFTSTFKNDCGDVCEDVYEIGDNWHDGDIERTDPILIEVVEELGDEASGTCAKLEIIEIPDDADWEISEYDGAEHVAEKHRTWG